MERGRRLVCALLCAAAVGWSAAAGGQPADPTGPPAADPVNAALGEPFELRLGGAARIESEGLELRFLEVTEDSRCPEGMVCVWAGRVRIRVAVAQRGTHLGELEISTLDPAQDTAPSLGAYGFSLVGVAPAGTGGIQPDPGVYVATLRVSRLG
jgi:hypothetical protein